MRSLTWHDVSRRRLVRNYLDEAAPSDRLVDAVGLVRGVQAQVMSAAELAIGARVTGVTQRDVREELWERRRLVKTYSLRGTLHLHPAAELPLWTAARKALPDWREGRWHESYGLEPEQAEAVLEAIGVALDGHHLTRDALADEVAARVGSWSRERLASTWADLIGLGFDAGMLCFGPSQGSNVTFVRTDQWLGESNEMDPDDALVEVFRRYLATYGPATHREFAEWFAPRRLKPDHARRLVESLADELEEVEVEGQHAWLAVGEGEAPGGPLHGSVRLLPQYDCYLIGCRFGRDHIIPKSAHSRVFAHKNGRFEGAVGLPVLLIDGVVAGMWERRKRGGRIEVRVEPFVRLTPFHHRLLDAQAARIGAFLDTEVALSVEPLG